MKNLTTPSVRQIPHTKWFRLNEDFVFQRPNGEKITVPKDFPTDFASVPRIFRPLFSTSGWYSTAAIIHDFMFQVDIDRSTLIFREALKEYRPDNSLKTKITIWILANGVSAYRNYKKWKSNQL